MNDMPRVLKQFLAFAAVMAAAVLPVADAVAQTGESPIEQRAARRARTTRTRSTAGPMNEADQAAGDLLDALFSDQPPSDPLATAADAALGVEHSAALRRGGFTGTLVRNPDQSDGNPPYALADRYGGVSRYIEPVDGVDLEAHIGQTVRVRRDTGGTLLATQLDLPRAAHSGNIMLAQHAEELPPGAIIEGDEVIMPDGDGPLYLDEGLDFPERHMHFGDGCPDCGGNLCPPNGCGFGSRPIFYARGDYMMMWGKGMQVPPLVVRGEVNNTTTPASFANPVVVYGNEEILKGQRNGGRVILGYWFDDYGQLGIEGEYFGLGKIDSHFIDGGDGTSPIVGRPYIDLTPGSPNLGLPAVEDVSFPGIMGTVAVDAESELKSGGIRLRRNLCCVGGCGPDCGDCVGCGSPVGCGSSILDEPFFPMFAHGSRHVDFIAGVRWMQLDENLRITEDLETTDQTTTFLLNDNFATSNEFFGGELGFIWEWRSRRWSLDVLSKLGLGNTRQRVSISGSTIRDLGTMDVTTKEGGLLTQTSNIGNYDRNVFAVIPELGVTLGYDITERLRFNVGYSFIYWSRVVRPGDQIDLDLNEEYLDFPTDPGYTPPGAPARPQFAFRDSDFWVQGLTLGFLYQY